MSEQRSDEQVDITMTAIGMTLIGVAVSIGVTVGFGIHSQWWIRLVAGVVTTAAILGGIAAGSRRINALRRAARWLTSYAPHQ